MTDAFSFLFFAFFICFGALHTAFFGKSVDLAAAERTEYSVAQALVFTLEAMEQLLHFLSFGCLICGAGGGDDRHRVLLDELLNLFFGHIDHRADQLDAYAGEISDGGEATKSALIEEVEHKGFYYVVEVVPQGDGGAAKLLCGGMEGAAAHFCAERAGIFLFSDLEDDLIYFGGDDVVGDVQLGAELFDGLEVHAALKAHVDGDGDKLEFFWVETAQICHGAEEGQRILAGGDANGDLVAFFYHIVIVDSSARVAEEAFHVFHKCILSCVLFQILICRLLSLKRK